MKLRVNAAKSAVARPWKRTFLGFSFTHHKKDLRIRVLAESIKGVKGNLKQLFRWGIGKNLERFIREDLNLVLRGWFNYFSKAEVKGYAEELDKWVRHHLRDLIWRQRKKPYTRCRRLRKRGLDEERACLSAMNGRGPWWNSGA